MEKRKITKSQLNFLEEELEYLKKENLITLDQKNEILDRYTLNILNFIKVILIIGSVLIGLGILSFIASNWKELSKLTKFLIVIGLYLSANIASFKLQDKYQKTSKSLLHLGTLIYGSGIFLVAQMFNYGGHFSNAFLLWGLGVLPLSYLFKDKVIFIFSHILFLIYLNGGFEIYNVSYWIILIIPILYYINSYLNNPVEGAFFNNLVLLNSIGYFLDKSNLDGFYITWIFLIIGMLMYYLPFKINNKVFKIVGSITFGICGLVLTEPYVWDNFKLFKDGITISIIFSVIYFIYLLLLTKKGNLISLIFICFTILRYYFDTFYDFMPKSVFFIIGGVILLGFGHYFERIRNKNGGDFIEI